MSKKPGGQPVEQSPPPPPPPVPPLDVLVPLLPLPPPAPPTPPPPVPEVVLEVVCVVDVKPVELYCVVDVVVCELVLADVPGPPVGSLPPKPRVDAVSALPDAQPKQKKNAAIDKDPRAVKLRIPPDHTGATRLTTSKRRRHRKSPARAAPRGQCFFLDVFFLATVLGSEPRAISSLSSLTLAR
jgi:hypothetical protein